MRVLQRSWLSLAGKPGVPLRCAALTALAQQGDNGQVRRVMYTALADPDPMIRTAAEHALQTIEGV